MKIRSLTAFEVPIELRKPVRHASHVRTQNDTLIIRCELDNGSVGWGEGLPRTYVTGESLESAWRHVTQSSLDGLHSSFADAQEASDLLDSVVLADIDPPDGVQPRQCFGNSVRCAMEVALLDAVCHAEGRSVGDWIASLPDASGLVERREDVFYSGVITSMTARQQWVSAWKMRLMGFRQVKVKVGTDGIDDVETLRRVRRIVGANVDLRVDANEAWQPDDVVSKVGAIAEFGVTSIEQPVPHKEVNSLSALRRELDVPIMLDESLCCREDAERAIADETCDLFNLRLSKCGGIRRCVELAAIAQRAGLGYQLGCQVGETGILSAAGRHFACNVGGIRYLEGSYDRFLVRESLTRENMTFGYRGRGVRLGGPGLGISIDDAHVRAIAKRTADLL